MFNLIVASVEGATVSIRYEVVYESKMIPCNLTMKSFSTFNDYIKNEEGKGINYLNYLSSFFREMPQIFQIFFRKLKLDVLRESLF